MDAFFNGLDGQLRVSGMVADSIMMGIVNSAMEDAYKRSCTKEGDLERLIEKSRFCELAIMQLEWCLKYLQEEMDSMIVDSTCDREMLLSDLLETRNRIHYRLEETNDAIAKKDVEITRRKERETKLRLALELKGEEVRSLHNTLGLERVKNETIEGSTSHDDINVNENEDHVFDELKCSVDKQLLKIRSKVEYGRQILTNMRQNMRTSSVDVAKSNAVFDMDSDGIKILHELHDMAQLTLDFDEIVIHIDMLKQEIRSSFETIESSISLFKETTEEQYWAWNMDREIANMIISSFLRDVQCECVANPGIHPILFNTNLPAFMDEIARLHDELEALVSQITMPSKADGVLDLKIPCNLPPRGNKENKDNLDKDTSLVDKNSSKIYHVDGVSRGGDDHIGETEKNDKLIDTSLEVGKLGNKNNQSKENSSGRFVADLIKNHETIIRRKSQEIDWIKGEICRERGCPSSRNDKTSYSVREMITKVISRLEGIQEEYTKSFVANSHHTRDIHTLRNIISDFEIELKETRLTQGPDEILEKPRDSSCCHELCKEIRKIKEEKDEMEIKAVIMDDISKIIVRRLLTNSFDVDLEVLLRENTFKVIFGQLVKELISMRENYISEQFLKEEIYYIVFSEVIKGIRCAENSALVEPPEKDTEFDSKLFQGCKTDGKLEQVQVKDSLLINSSVEEDLAYVLNSKMIKHNSQDLNRFDIEDIIGYTMQNVQLLPNKGDDFNSDSNIDTTIQQQIAGTEQLGELLSDYDSNVDDDSMANDPMISTRIEEQNRNDSCMSAGFVENQCDDFHFMLKPIESFSHMVMDFGLITCEKIRINILRLDDLIRQLNPIMEQVNLIKRNEELYHKAFTKRCYNLQTAEAEVDLLGDEVDILFNLLEKIYVALDHYSPVLQHYSGITEILRLIQREIYGEVTRTPRH